MTIEEEARSVKNDPEALKKFCFRMFDLGKDWLDIEALMEHVGYDDGDIYRLYEEWQNEKYW